MDARLQRRVQRYGWDLAAARYETLWQRQLAPAQQAVLELAALRRGEQVLDVACGTGLVGIAAAHAVAPAGGVLGIDVAARMVDAARRAAPPNARFERMDAESPALPEAAFDAALCALGLMYLPEPQRAVQAMRRALRAGGRIALAVWGERARCGWAPVFEIVDAEVASEVCPLFFGLGAPGALTRLLAGAGFAEVAERRIATTLGYAGADEACDAAFVGGPVALAWSRFDAAVRERVRARYLAAIERWRDGARYRLPGEFVVAAGRVPAR